MKTIPIKTQQITVDLLIRAGISPNQARAFEKPLQHACGRFEINTVHRLAAFLGQCAHESLNFTHLEESLYYTTPGRIMAMWSKRVPNEAMARSLLRNPKLLANTVYANRGGNGDAASNDGWNYRGRGIIQLTLKDNYARAQFEIQRPYVDQPELVAEPWDAALTAAWYWATHKCNVYADSWDIDSCTRAINGNVMAGRNQRLVRCDQILSAMTGED